jgi:hypothetical protein
MPDEATQKIGGRKRLFFIYNFGPTQVLANQGATLNISLESQSDFLCVKTTGIATDTDGILVQINDTQQSGNWIQNAMPGTHLFGQAGRPYILPEPRYLLGRTVITITLQDTSGANNTVAMEFHGYKVYGS